MMAQAVSRFGERKRLPHVARAFTTALPAFDAFPMSQWSRLSAKYLRGARDDILGYGDPAGSSQLRRALASHLRVNRGITCDPAQIFIVGGAQQAFHLIGSTLLNPGENVWFENPGAIGARNSLIACGANLVPVPVDTEGLQVETALRLSPRFRLAFVTPSHQQPMGCVMSLARRFALLHAAQQCGAWVIEDDYDGEFFWRPTTTHPQERGHTRPGNLCRHLQQISFPGAAPGLFVGAASPGRHLWHHDEQFFGGCAIPHPVHRGRVH